MTKLDLGLVADAPKWLGTRNTRNTAPHLAPQHLPPKYADLQDLLLHGTLLPPSNVRTYSEHTDRQGGSNDSQGSHPAPVRTARRAARSRGTRRLRPGRLGSCPRDGGERRRH